MNTKTIIVALATLLIGSLCFWACQKEDPLTQTPESESETETGITLKSDPIDCSTHCIDPDDPVYCEKEQEKTVTWGNPRNPFTKTTNIVYYNTLTHFVLKVMSTNGIADVLMDDESIKNFEGTIPPDEWHEFSFELEADWEACDIWAFELKIAGFGPPAYFDVEYQLIGECIYYTLDLAVYPEGAGTVSGAGEYKEDEAVELSAIANEGWEFVNWTDGDDAEISNMADFTYTMPAYDVTLTANFEEEDEDPGFTCGDNITFTYRGQEVTYGTVLSNGLCWLDRNLGASQVATTSTDADAYGDLFQWGRLDDGHQDRLSEVTSTLSNFDQPGHELFILSSESPYDWRNPQNEILWQGVNGINNPCPTGWRIPTSSEWDTERLSWFSNNAAGAYNSPLKLPLAGDRHARTGEIQHPGNLGIYHSSTVYPTMHWYLYFNVSNTAIYRNERGFGRSIRCIKDDTSD